MIVLDTNVVSEAIKAYRNPAVLRWLDDQPVETLFLTATSLSELFAGTERLPAGKRKDNLAAGLKVLVERLFGERILPFDRQAAMVYASIFNRARAKGRPILIADAQIAAVAQAHGFTVATRDTGPFEAAGVPFINPWER
jgi:predicted nucleic acid-binding protein